MANLFDSTNAQEGEPLEVIPGDFLQWKRSDIAVDYPTSEGYTAEYVARITDGGSTEIKLQQAAGSTDTEYLFVIDSATTAAFLPGIYHWQLEITQTSSGNRIVVDTGDFNCIPDLDSNQADPRTHAEKMVALLEAAIETKIAGGDVAEYSINGRSLKKMTYDELYMLRDKYKKEVVSERHKELIKRGKKNGATIKVKF